MAYTDTNTFDGGSQNGKDASELYEALFGSPASNEDFINNYFDTLSKERESAQPYVPMQFASSPASLK